MSMNFAVSRSGPLFLGSLLSLAGMDHRKDRPQHLRKNMHRTPRSEGSLEFTWEESRARGYPRIPAYITPVFVPALLVEG